MPTKPSEHADSPSLDAELAFTNSETKSEEEVPVIKAGDQDKGQAGPNPGEQDEGQAGSNPDDAVESQPQASHVVHAGPNLEHMDLVTTDASTQQKPEQMDEEFTTTAYPNVQENLKLLTEDQVSKAVDEIVTDVVDWAMQAPLRARFRDLPTVDMKEILQQRMFEDNTYKTHEVHNDLYEALQKSVELDYSNQRLADQEEARVSGSPCTYGASRSSQLPPPPPHPSTRTSGSAYQQGSQAPSSSKTAASAS
ncbi:hypothetical protein Tco_1301063 [Tanacetum coccineum]